jgi:hypothetical protein
MHVCFTVLAPCAPELLSVRFPGSGEEASVSRETGSRRAPANLWHQYFGRVQTKTEGSNTIAGELSLYPGEHRLRTVVNGYERVHGGLRIIGDQS